MPQEVVEAINDVVDVAMTEFITTTLQIQGNEPLLTALPNEVSHDMANLMRERFEKYYREGRWDGTFPVNIQNPKPNGDDEQ